MHISCTNTMQLIPLLLNRKQISSFIPKTVEIYEVPCSLWFCSGKKQALWSVAHLELIISAYFILTSIEAKAFIRIKLRRAIPSLDPYMAPLPITQQAVLCSQEPLVMVTDLTSCEKSLVRIEVQSKKQKAAAQSESVVSSPPDSHQRRSTRPGTPL